MKHKQLKLLIKIFLVGVFLISQPVIASNKRLKLNTGHYGWVNKLAFNYSGDFLVTAGEDGAIKLWDTKTQKEIKTIYKQDDAANFIDCSPVENITISCWKDVDEIPIVDILNGEIVNILKGHTDKVLSAIFDPTGSLIASASEDRTVRIWDVNSGTVLQVLKHPSYVKRLAFSPNGKLLISTTGNKSIHIWNTSNWLETGRIESAHSSGISAVVFNTNGDKIITSSWDKTLKIWDISTKANVAELSGHTGWIRDVICENGKIYSCADEELKVWDEKTGEKISTITTKYNNYCLAYNNEKSLLGYSGESCEIELISTETEQIIAKNALNLKPTSELKYSQDGRFFAIRFDNKIKIWNALSGQLVKILTTESTIRGFNFSVDSKKIASGTQDGTIYIWNIADGTVETQISAHNEYVSDVIFNAKGDKIVSCSGDCTIKIWNIISETLEVEMNKLPYPALDLVYTLGEKRLASGNLDGNVSIWDVENGNLISKTDIRGSTVESIELDNVGNIICSGSSFGEIFILNSNSGEIVNKLDANHSDHVLKIVKSTHGNLFASKVKDGLKASLGIIEIWDMNSKKIIKSFKSLSTPLAFTPDEKYIILGGNTIEFLEIENLEVKSTLVNFDNSDFTVFDPQSRFDGTINAIDELYFVENNSIIALSNLFEHFYTPKLFSRTFSEEKLSKTEYNPFATNILPPIVKITSPHTGFNSNNEHIQVSVKAIDQGGGVDEIRLYHNGKLIETSLRGFKSTKENYENFTVNLSDGENKLHATAFNDQRAETISNDIIVNFNAPKQVKPNMYVLSVAINQYKNPKYNLNYAVNDSEAFVDILNNGAKSIFENVYVSKIYNDNATRKEVIENFNSIIAKAAPQDVFVFYYAGHGVMSEEVDGSKKSQYFFVTNEVTQMYLTSQELIGRAISAEELLEFSRKIKAQKQLIVIDACQSGGAVQTFAMRGAAEEKAIAQLARSSGSYVLAASGTKQFATEVSSLGHGIFTYSIIQSLSGKCAANDNKVTVNELKSCVENLVPELSKKHKGQAQYPTGFGYGQDFPLVIVK